jgi:16S rRNA (cytosine967-C5)-methyltransferase
VNRPAGRRTRVTGDPRQDAPRALVEVLSGRRRSTDVVNEALAAWPGEARDAGLFQALVMGVLRRRMSLAAVLAPLLRRRLDASPPLVREVLLCLAYQSLYMQRVPSHARVSASVEAARRLTNESAAGFVNAVGRGLEKLLASGDPLAGQSAELRASIPAFIMAHVKAVDPGPWDDSLLETLAAEAPSVLRVNRMATTRDAVLEQLHAREMTVRPTLFAPDGIAVDQGTPLADRSLVPRILVPQDEASQLVVEALAPRNGERILDLCAGTGIKTSQILAIAPEASIRAVDIDGQKLQRCRELCLSMGLPPPETVVADARALADPGLAGQQDAVLLDAPCTGLGTLVRRPEVRYLRTDTDVARCATMQLELLEAASRLLKPGGRLVYAVCSFTRMEGPDVIDAALARIPGLRLDPIPLDAPFRLPDGTLRILPWRHGMDGFCVAKFRREA